MKSIKIDGISFFKNKRHGVWHSVSGIYLHRYVWSKRWGTVPTGFIVAFKDGNKDNVELDNLTCISKSASQRKNYKKHKDKGGNWENGIKAINSKREQKFYQGMIKLNKFK